MSPWYAPHYVTKKRGEKAKPSKEPTAKTSQAARSMGYGNYVTVPARFLGDWS